MQFGHVLDFGVYFEHQEHGVCNHQGDVHHLLADHLFDVPLFVPHFDLNLLLLLTREHPAGGIAHPEKHVIVQSQVEESNHFGGLALHALPDELRDLLDQVAQVHGWHPLGLALGQDVHEKVATICQRRLAERSLSHDKWGLEGELVPQQDIEVESFQMAGHVRPHGRLLNLELLSQ